MEGCSIPKLDGGGSATSESGGEGSPTLGPADMVKSEYLGLHAVIPRPRSATEHRTSVQVEDCA